MRIARASDELRPIEMLRNYTKHAEGSVLVIYGDTKVICNASIQEGTPKWLKTGGWLTAEYGMLPRATQTRGLREAAKGGFSGRTQEIQRLIGRSLRAALDLSKLGPYTIHLDCDVIQADGGTRTASISGACVALYDAITYMRNQGSLKLNPFKFLLASVSVGMYLGKAVLDLDYQEDVAADTDMNVVMTEDERFIEVQGTAEGEPYTAAELQAMLDLAKLGIKNIINYQKQLLNL